MKKYKLLNIRENNEVVMSLSEILEEINRDRSNEWEDYTKSDWQEGLEFTEYELLGEIK